MGAKLLPHYVVMNRKRSQYLQEVTSVSETTVEPMVDCVTLIVHDPALSVPTKREILHSTNCDHLSHTFDVVTIIQYILAGNDTQLHFYGPRLLRILEVGPHRGRFDMVHGSLMRLQSSSFLGCILPVCEPYFCPLITAATF